MYSVGLKFFPLIYSLAVAMFEYRDYGSNSIKCTQYKCGKHFNDINSSKKCS